MFLYFARHPESKTSQGTIFPKRTIFPKDLPLVLEVLNLKHKPKITFQGLKDFIKIELTWSLDRNISSSNKESNDEIKCTEINEKERDISTTSDIEVTSEPKATNNELSKQKIDTILTNSKSLELPESVKEDIKPCFIEEVKGQQSTPVLNTILRQEKETSISFDLDVTLSDYETSTDICSQDEENKYLNVTNESTFLTAMEDDYSREESSIISDLNEASAYFSFDKNDEDGFKTEISSKKKADEKSESKRIIKSSIDFVSPDICDVYIQSSQIKSGLRRNLSEIPCTKDNKKPQNRLSTPLNVAAASNNDILGHPSCTSNLTNQRELTPVTFIYKPLHRQKLMTDGVRKVQANSNTQYTPEEAKDTEIHQKTLIKAKRKISLEDINQFKKTGDYNLFSVRTEPSQTDKLDCSTGKLENCIAEKGTELSNKNTQLPLKEENRKEINGLMENSNSMFFCCTESMATIHNVGTDSESATSNCITQVGETDENVNETLKLKSDKRESHDDLKLYTATVTANEQEINENDNNHPVTKANIYKLTQSKDELKPNGKPLMQSSIFTKRQFDKEKVGNEENACKPEVNACTRADDVFVFGKENEELDWEEELEYEQENDQEDEQVYEKEDEQEYEQEDEQVYEMEYEQEDEEEDEQENEQKDEQVYEQEDEQEYEKEDKQEDKQEDDWGYEWEYEQEYDFEDEQEYKQEDKQEYEQGDEDEQEDEQQDEKEEELAEKQTNRLFRDSSTKQRGARFLPQSVPINQIVTRYNCAESPTVSNWTEYFSFYGTKVLCYDGEMIFQLHRKDRNPELDFVAYIVRDCTPMFPAERKAVLISEPAHRFHDPRVWCYYKWIYNIVTNSEAQEWTPNGLSFYDLKSNLATYEQWVITAFTNFKENEEVEVEEELEERYPPQGVPLNQIVTRYNCAENPIVSNWTEYFRFYGTKVMCYDGEMIFQLCRKDKNPELDFVAYIVRDCTPMFPAERKAVLISEPAHRLHDPRVWGHYRKIYNIVKNRQAQTWTPNGISFYDLKTKLEIYEKWVITAFTNTNY